MAEGNPDVSIIIPVHERWDLTHRCLEHLRATLVPADAGGSRFEVVVADNGSTDETRTECTAFGAALFGDRFRYERSERNLNFSGGCNLGARAALGRRLFFLNNDTRVCAGWLPPLMAAMDASSAPGAVGPLLLYPGSARVQHLGITFNPGLRVQHLYEYFPAGHPAVRSPRTFQAISAAALMIGRETFFGIGGFHEGYRNGFEDIDLCLALRERGLELTVVPESVIEHLAMQSPGREANDAANEALLRSRWPDAVRPDLHEFVARDGFELRVTPWLTAHAALPLLRERELDREHADALQHGDIARLWAAVRDEPLWGAGYDRLADAAEARDEPSMAVDALMLRCSLLPALGPLDRLRRLAEAADRPQVAHNATLHLATARSRLADAYGLKREAARIARLLTRQGERELAMSYASALEKGLATGRSKQARSRC